MITKKESLLTDIKKRIVKARDAESKATAAKEKIAGTKEELYRAEMAFSNAQTKVESGKSLLTQASNRQRKSKNMSLSSFGGKLLKSTAPSSLRKSFLPMTPNSSNVDC